MNGLFRLLLIVLTVAVACAGLPVHACPGPDQDHSDQEAQTMVPVEDGCPFHAAKAPQPPDGLQETGDDGADCCQPDCTCGCSAPVPAPVTMLTAEAAPAHGPVQAPPSRFEASLSPDRLLRPPQHRA